MMKWREILSKMTKGKYIRTEETRRKMSEAHKGMKTALGKHWKCSEEHNRKTSKTLKEGYASGRIKKQNANSKVIHHINGNHNDDRPENRTELTLREHVKLHIKQGDYFGWQQVKEQTE